MDRCLLACNQSTQVGATYANDNLDIKWQRRWFSNIHRFPRSHWDSEENCRRFIDEISINSNIQTISDWRKISTTLIKNRGGVVSCFDFLFIGRDFFENIETLFL